MAVRSPSDRDDREDSTPTTDADGDGDADDSASLPAPYRGGGRDPRDDRWNATFPGETARGDPDVTVFHAPISGGDSFLLTYQHAHSGPTTRPAPENDTWIHAINDADAQSVVNVFDHK